MALPLYLAMTAAESFSAPMPENMAYMACHFASYGLGISNIPAKLPAGAMLILNDRIPLWEHDPLLVARQLSDAVTALDCSYVLLDFQRQNDPKATAVVRAVTDVLLCPVAISEYYAQGLECPVFVSAPPPDRSLEEHLTPWKGREIWLEAALETVQITIDSQGARATSLPLQTLSEPYHCSTQYCCSYITELWEDHAVFTLSRNQEDLCALLKKAEGLGVARAVGLYQQLKELEK